MGAEEEQEDSSRRPPSPPGHLLAHWLLRLRGLLAGVCGKQLMRRRWVFALWLAAAVDSRHEPQNARWWCGDTALSGLGVVGGSAGACYNWPGGGDHCLCVWPCCTLQPLTKQSTGRGPLRRNTHLTAGSIAWGTADGTTTAPPPPTRKLPAAAHSSHATRPSTSHLLLLYVLYGASLGVDGGARGASVLCGLIPKSSALDEWVAKGLSSRTNFQSKRRSSSWVNACVMVCRGPHLISPRDARAV